MEFGQLMTDILVNVSCKFEMHIFKIAQVTNENVRFAFIYVLSISRHDSIAGFLYRSLIKRSENSCNSSRRTFV